MHIRKLIREGCENIQKGYTVMMVTSLDAISSFNFQLNTT